MKALASPAVMGCHASSTATQADSSLIQTAEELIITQLAYSGAGTRFPLHGAWGVVALLGSPSRPTRGIDLIDRTRGTADDIAVCLADAIGSSPSGLRLFWSDLRIRTKAARRSPLHRLTIPVQLGHRRLDLRIDVTAARDPAPRTLLRPLRPAPRHRLVCWVTCCSAEEIVAEKAALLVTYGADHTRLQDIFDLWLFSQQLRLDGPNLIKIMTTTFAGRDASRMLKRDDGYWEGAFDPSRFGVVDRERWSSLPTMGDALNDLPPLSDALRAVGRVLRPLLLAVRIYRALPAADVWSC